MKQNEITSILLGAIILTILSGVVNLFFETPQQSSYHYLWNFIANLLISILFSLLIKDSVLNKEYLILFVLIVYFTIACFNTLIEAYIFGVTTSEQTIREMTRGFLGVVLFSPITTFLYQQKRALASLHFKPRKLFSWVWRIMLGNFLYLFLYLMAGGILVTVYPQLLDFYAGKVPPLPLMIKTQLFLRGFVFIGIALLILRTINLPLPKRACLVGLTFSILGGIAPLIQSNELMPAFVRYGHLVEVGISNFVFGLLLSYLIGQKRIIAATTYPKRLKNRS